WRLPRLLGDGVPQGDELLLGRRRAPLDGRASRDPLRGGTRLAPAVVLVPLRPPQQDLVDLQRRRQRLGERRAQAFAVRELVHLEVPGAGELVLARLGDLLESLDRLRQRLALPGTPDRAGEDAAGRGAVVEELVQDRGLLPGLGLDRVLLRSEEHTSELQSRENLVCRLLLEKRKTL